MIETEISSFEPSWDWLVLKPKHMADVTQIGKILIANVGDAALGEAELVAVGPDSKLTAGDNIIYNKKAGAELRDGSETYLLIRDLPDLIHGRISKPKEIAGGTNDSDPVRVQEPTTEI